MTQKDTGLSIQEIKEKYKKGLMAVVKDRRPIWRSDGLMNQECKPNDSDEDVLIEGLPPGVYICDLLKKYRKTYFRSIFQCLGYLKENGYKCHLEDWSYFEEGYVIPSEDELTKISTIIGFPVQEMLQLRRVQKEKLQYKITDKKIFILKQDARQWEHQICGIIATSNIFFEQGLVIHPLIRNTLVFSSGTIDFFEDRKNGLKQSVTLEVLWNHWVRNFWSGPKEEFLDVDSKQVEMTKNLLPITISYTISDHGSISLSQIIDEEFLIHTEKGNKYFQHWYDPIELHFSPNKVSDQAIPHTLTSMIYALKNQILEWDLSNLNSENPKLIRRYSKEDWYHIEDIIKMEHRHVLHILDKECKIFEKGPNIEITPNPKVYSHWSRDKSFFVEDFELHPHWVKKDNNYILACNRPLPVEWWLHYIKTEWLTSTN